MDLRDALGGVTGYSHLAGRGQAAQQHLWEVPRNPPPELPLGLNVRVSGSGQSLPLSPWIALLDPDVTTTAQEGLYLVYLFDRTVQRVYLSMNQGATQHLQQAKVAGLKGRAAEDAAIAEIGAETAALRVALGQEMLMDTAGSIELGAEKKYYLPRGYQAGSIAAIEYAISDLPTSSALGEDLAKFAVLYGRCIEVKDQLAANSRVRTTARSRKKRTIPAPTPVFKPKDSAEYFAKVSAATQKRTRTHEALIGAFGAALRSDCVPATNVHPRDMTVREGNNHWLVEAKTVGTNAEHAVREAIGQLMSYRHFYYREAGVKDPRLLALFSAPIGAALEELLASLGIEVVYRDGANWDGSAAGRALIV